MIRAHATPIDHPAGRNSRISREILQFQPWDLVDWRAPLNHAEGIEAPLFVWRGPSGDLQILAWGALETSTAEGSERFERCLNSCSLRAEQYSDHAPLWVGGLAFAEKGPVWETWPAACFYRPRLMAVGNTTHFRMVLSLRPDESLQEAEQELERLAGAAIGHQESTTRSAPSPEGSFEQRPPNGAKGAWKSLVQKARDAMNAPRRPPLQKVVLARAVPYRAPAGEVFSISETLRALANRHPASTVFALRPPRDPEHQAFVGATPETLAIRDGYRIETAALAGTALKGSKDAEELCTRVKELHEHALVVDAIRDGLCGLSRSLKSDPRPRIKELADIVHLETRISATLKRPTHLLEVAAELHPTPAVGGTPTVEALPWLAAHENLDRGYYAGPIGFFDGEGNGRFAVALRSARIDAQRAVAYVGAGITPASDPEAEWDETEQKLRTIERSLRITRNGNQAP